MNRESAVVRRERTEVKSILTFHVSRLTVDHSPLTTHHMTIAEFDQLDVNIKRNFLYQCCGSNAWVEKVLAELPAEDLVELMDIAEEQWYKCTEADWREAFTQHPMIGDKQSLKTKFGTAHPAVNEQVSVNQASEQILQELADLNKAYEEKFGYIFIVFATGKSPEEMLSLLKERLNNDPKEEIINAMEEQNKITRLRLEKIFAA